VSDYARSRQVVSAVGIYRLPKEFRWDGYLDGRDTGQGSNAWKAALAALETDADTALPSE
jgi:hypothetical protein